MIDVEKNDVKTYVYDASNRLTAIKDGSGKTLTAYDAKGRLTKGWNVLDNKVKM